MVNEIGDQLEDVQALAKEAVAAKTEAEEAVGAEREAKAKVLELLVELARPALRVICSRYNAGDGHFRGAELARRGPNVLYLLESGGFGLVAWGPSGRSANMSPIGVSDVVEGRWSVVDIATKVADDLASNLDGQKSLAEKARRLERKFRAVAELLEG